MHGVLFVVAMLTAQIEVKPPSPVPAASDAPQVERTATAYDAVGWAVADATLLPPDSRPFVRYLWVPPWGSADWHKINSFAVNTAVSHASTIQLPDGVAGGFLIRWDLRRLAPKDADLVRLIKLWDSLADVDPYFHFRGKLVRVAVAQYKASDGRTYNFKFINGTIPAPHFAEAHVILEGMTLTRAPILRADWFTLTVLTTIDGGRYYDFIGFKQGGQRLTEAQILKTVGAEVALSRQVEGDDRVGMFESSITGKARTVEAGQGAVGRWWITYDLFDEDNDPTRHPIYNLLGFVDNARGKEGIFERSNGMHGFFLTNGKGELVDEAPPNLATDHDIPAPHTKRLQPAMSCIRCHGPNDGLQPAPNDVKTLLSGRLDVFDDFGNLRAGRIENVDRLAGLYAGDFTKRLRLGRDDYSSATFASTRGLSVAEASQLTAEMYAAYRLAKVTPDQAAIELGFKVKAGGGAAALRANVPDLKAGGLIIDAKKLAVEDPAIAALLQGMSIRRVDFERVFPDISLRISKGNKK